MANNASTDTTLVLQEKWNESFKKHPIANGFLLLLTLVWVVLSIYGLFGEGDYRALWTLLAFWLLLMLLLNIPVLKRLRSPKRYEVTIADERLNIKRNGLEILNVKGEDITFLQFVKYYKDIIGLNLKYKNENSETVNFSMKQLSFIPREECREFANRVATFYAKCKKSRPEQ